MKTHSYKTTWIQLFFFRESQLFWKHTPRHTIIISPTIKGKERILKAGREKETVTYKGVPVSLSADFSKETLQARSIQS